MVIDALVEQIKQKGNPCIVGIDPDWNKIPDCYKIAETKRTDAVSLWATDVIDAVSDLVPAVKPQAAFFEVYGAEGMAVLEHVVEYAHQKGLLVIDDSKRNDIGNTARAYAYAHLAKDGPINADFLTISPFLGTDSLQPFMDTALEHGKGVFVLVKTSNPGSAELSEARNNRGQKLQDWLADYVDTVGSELMGESGYSSVGAVVGATFPGEAAELRQRMRHNFFLVPGYGAQGGSSMDVVPCFNSDGLGAVVNASRGILYHYLMEENYNQSREMYQKSVRTQAIEMRDAVYMALKSHYTQMVY